jgi:hypothetical protein
MRSINTGDFNMNTPPAGFLVAELRPRAFRFLPVIASAMLLTVATGCLSPEFVNQVRVGLGNRFTPQLYPVAPGEEPYVLVRLTNNTSSILDVIVSWDTGAGEQSVQITDLDPEYRETAFLLEWPITRLGLGDLDDPLESTAITATLPDGAFSTVSAFIPPLEAGTDFGRGDTIYFDITESGQSPSFIYVSVGRVNAEKQPTEFTRADPFEAVRLLLDRGGF